MRPKTVNINGSDRSEMGSVNAFVFPNITYLSQGMYWYTVGHLIGAVPSFGLEHHVLSRITS